MRISVCSFFGVIDIITEIVEYHTVQCCGCVPNGFVWVTKPIHINISSYAGYVSDELK